MEDEYDRLAVTVSFKDGATNVAMEGVLDTSTVSGMRAVVAGLCEGHPAVVLDLERLTFLDSTGLGVIIHLWQTLSDHGCDLRVVAVPRRIQHVLDLTGLSKVMPVEMLDH